MLGHPFGSAGDQEVWGRLARNWEVQEARTGEVGCVAREFCESFWSATEGTESVSVRTEAE